MNAKQLNAIKERAEKATPGDWKTDEHRVYSEKMDDDFICEMWTSFADAEFIANARQDIPQLVAEVERLQQRLSTAESLLSEAHDVLDDVHCYETGVYVDISKYLYGEEE